MTEARVTARPEAPQQIGLSEALLATFRPKQANADFAVAIAGLAQALCNAQSTYLIVAGAENSVRDLATGRPVPEEVALAATDLLIEGGPEIVRQKSVIVARVALPDMSRAVLAVVMQRGEGVLQSLGHERLTMLAHQSFAAFDQTASAANRQLAQAVEGGDPKAIADALAAAAEADYVAVGHWDGRSIDDVIISGQTAATERAALPETLRASLRDIVLSDGNRPASDFLPDASQQSGLVIHVEAPGVSPAELKVLLRGVSALSDPDRAARRKPAWRKRALAGLAVLGVCCVPLPDGVEVPAELVATEARVVTTPLAAVLEEVLVSPSDTVVAGETILAKMDTTDIVSRLIAAQAERARAVLERETARSSRNASELRLAELEVERLDAEIALHESERDRGTLVAPISGIVIATGLAQQQGTMLRQGETLMEIANPEALRLDLSIPDEAIAKLNPGTEGTFRPDFDPSRRFGATITTVSPAVSETLEIPIFPGRADIEGETTGLGPGMKGVMSIDRTLRPAGLIVWESVRDWFLLRVWP